ncbi:sugar MFS transporter [Sulfurimonas autotrophica]|uniref:Glucose/galactose transporter n=1 Tax=Sulfurimonas autotrophica (strain ATCC BAA-671 / DSM 16294 / JCM 11897 / OK10) TaxID=563040 RepID=E0UT95_SULAO|nr:sugar MFS transporter [Sulfurimonas autotrophica]ADN08198.1 glucose/galactose transporter [Sulfurimonas autotrophica DSM 16294]
MHKQSSFLAMIIIGVLFFIFGFVTWLNGSLIPYLKVICDLNEFEALFVTFAFYIAYTVMALPMAVILEKTGYKKGMALGLFVMSLGSLLFIPAALSGEFLVFLAALFTLGTGLTILQTASNPYIVLLGPIESAAMRISIMGLINKSAGVLAPLLFTALILSDIGSSSQLVSTNTQELAYKLIKPYIIMSIMLLVLTLFVWFSSLPELEFEDDPYDDENIFGFPRVVLGALALFFYVGIEVIAGDTIGLYGQSLGIANATALTAYTMSFMVAGYLVGVFFIPKFLSQEKALVSSALLGIFFLFGVAFSSTTESHIITGLPDSVAFVAMLGLANALVWPTIWPLALQDLGKHTAKGSALLIMAIAGGAVLPLVFGKVAQITADMQMSYLVGIVCYVMILFYGLKWHKMTGWRA